MSGRPRSQGDRRLRPVCALALIAAVASWSCAGTEVAPPLGASGVATGVPTAAVASPATGTRTPARTGLAPTSEPALSPDATTSVGPPPAWLIGPVRGEVPGDLGSFSWDGLVSDSPWIVEPTGDALAAGTRPRVRLDGDPAHVAWTARWARIEGGDTRRPVLAGRGTDEPVIVDPPPGAGSWSLRLEATFGEGRRATWYWRVRVQR